MAALSDHMIRAEITSLSGCTDKMNLSMCLIFQRSPNHSDDWDYSNSCCFLSYDRKCQHMTWLTTVSLTGCVIGRELCRLKLLFLSLAAVCSRYLDQVLKGCTL